VRQWRGRGRSNEYLTSSRRNGREPADSGKRDALTKGGGETGLEVAHKGFPENREEIGRRGEPGIWMSGYQRGKGIERWGGTLPKKEWSKEEKGRITYQKKRGPFPPKTRPPVLRGSRSSMETRYQTHKGGIHHVTRSSKGKTTIGWDRVPMWDKVQKTIFLGRTQDEWVRGDRKTKKISAERWSAGGKRDWTQQ